MTRLIRSVYLSNFNDPLISGRSDPGGWFESLIFLEGAVQLPVCFYVVLQYARQKQHETVTRIIIIAYSVQVMTATWACIFETLAFADLSFFERANLLGFYLPYLIIPSLMAWYSSKSVLSESKKRRRELQYLREHHDKTKSDETAVRSKTILITGANSGVGFGIVQQLIDQHEIALSYGTVRLTLVLTVRNESKAKSILTRLANPQEQYKNNLTFDFVYMDLLEMSSIESAAQTLASKYPTGIDSIICNAGMAQFSHLDLVKATLQFLTHPVLAISEPNYKVQTVGGLSTDGLGATFQANVFGHYYLAKRLIDMHVLRRTGTPNRSTIIWMSSLEATNRQLDPQDIQAKSHEYAYESSKRLIDIMWSSSDLGVKQYLVHPGFCSTNIVAETMHPTLVPLIGPLWTSIFYLARSLGSHFHTATAYNGAYAAARVAIDPEVYNNNTKWGSAGAWDGQSLVLDTKYDEIDASMATQVVKEMNDLRDQWTRRLSTK